MRWVKKPEYFVGGSILLSNRGSVQIGGEVFSFVFLKGDVSYHSILWRQVVLGIGIVFFNPANNSAIIGSLPKEKIGLASSFLALSRNLGMVVGVAFAEMVITFRSSVSSLETGKPSLESIQDVWKLVMILGLSAVLISWLRGSSRSGRLDKMVL